MVLNFRQNLILLARKNKHTRIKFWRKACVPFGSTGYPFAFGMKVEAGRKTCDTGSACHRERISEVEGRGRDKSKAKIEIRDEIAT